jgi:hypothetical protein
MYYTFQKDNGTYKPEPEAISVDIEEWIETFLLATYSLVPIWIVCEATTGNRISSSAKSADIALNNAATMLVVAGKIETQQRIAEHIAKYGASPYVKEKQNLDQ